jgi:hypothetical protein
MSPVFSCANVFFYVFVLYMPPARRQRRILRPHIPPSWFPLQSSHTTLNLNLRCGTVTVLPSHNMILSNAVSRSVLTTPYSATLEMMTTFVQLLSSEWRPHNDNHPCPMHSSTAIPFSGPLFGFHKYKVIPIFQTVSNWVGFNDAQTNYQGGIWARRDLGGNWG